MKRICAVSGERFEISDSEIAFYNEIDVPPPTLSPTERMRRRLSFRNERNLYRRICDGSGTQIISMHAPGVPYPVYDNVIWWGDSWDALSYGRPFDFSRPFFAQFRDLLHVVPRMAKIRQGEFQNSDYCNCVTGLKDCYLCFSSMMNEGCLYCTFTRRSRDCIDCYGVMDSELCAECVQCLGCYRGIFLENCSNCSDSAFLRDCIGCSNCIGCVGLRNGSYVFFGEKCEPSEYARKISALKLDTQSGLMECGRRFDEISKDAPWKEYVGINNENVTGNYISNSKNSFHCFDAGDIEESSYCQNVTRVVRCMDVSYYGGLETNEYLYECEGVGNGASRVLFSKLVWGGSFEVAYSYECFASNNIFGCVGVKNASYTILNVKYPPAEYKKLREKIVSHMKETGEWGEFFPQSLSPFGYNESVAHEYLPLSEEEVQSRGGFWREIPPLASGNESYSVPNGLSEIGDEILTKIIVDADSGRPFKVQRRELFLHRELGLPFSALGPESRYRIRFRKRVPRALYLRTCSACAQEIQTAISPAWSARVLCEKCYNTQ